MEKKFHKNFKNVFAVDGNYHLFKCSLHSLNVNERDKLGNTILHYASTTKDFRKFQIVTKMIDAQDRSIINVINNCGNHALHIAVEFSTVKIVEFLISWGKVNVNIWNPFYGLNALHLAVIHRQYEITYYLITQCPHIDLTKTDKYNYTVEMIASKLNDRRMLKLIRAFLTKSSF